MRTAYLRFCLYFGFTPVPASHRTVILYAVFLARTLNPRSIPSYLNIIRLMHLNVGLPNPLLEDWELDMIKKGIARLHGCPPCQKLPITPAILLRIKDVLDLSTSFDRAFWCACLIAFYSFLRKASLLPRSAASSDNKSLCHRDLEISGKENMLYLTVRHTKTIQFGQRTLRIPIAGQPDSPLCPFTAATDMLSHLPASQPADAPLFSYVGRCDSVTCLDYNSFVQKLKAVLALAGFPPVEYSGHSFRRGGCSFAFGLGIPPLLLKLRGDWKSSAYERYVNVNDTMNIKVAKAISIGASGTSK